jgi:glycosyltransferase involved in cell wall biosynthesis
MNILSLNFERSWRGGERQTLFNAIGLIEKGFDVHLICRKGSDLEKRALQEKLKVFSFKSTIAVLFFLIRNARKYNVLHAQGSKILTYCILSKPFHRAKIIFTRRINFRPKGKLTRLKYRLCDRIVAISSSVKNIVAEFSSRNDVEIISDVVVEKPIHPKAIDERLKKVNPHQKKIIGTIAALTSEKNPLDNIEAVRLLQQKRDDFIFLHFGEGKMKDEMIRLIDQYHLNGTYFLMGFVDNVNDYFSAMEGFIMTSSNEGLCSSVLDAFIYKVPVVSTHAGGLQDLINEDRGIACEINNPMMIAEGIDTILNNAILAKEQTERAYEYVLRQHSMEHISERYALLIKSLFKNEKKS